MTDTTPDWLHRQADRLYAAASTSPDAAHQAAAIGQQAAADNTRLSALVDVFLAAATRHWRSTKRENADPEHLHAAATDLLHTMQALTASAMHGYHQHTRTELSRQDDERDQFISDLLSGRADPGRLAHRAHRYGIRLAGTHTVIVARGNTLNNTVAGRVDDALATRYGAGNTLTTLRDGQIICLATGGLRGLPAELAHHLLTHLGPTGWQIGVGRPHPGPHGITTSLDEATGALDLAAKLGFTTPVLHAADLLVFPVLLRDRDAITDLVTTVLGPLATARGGPQPLLDTLTALFDNQGNHTATARQLHLSVRAVTYRLDRIHTLTGYHPGEPTQRFTLQTAVLGARLLGWSAKAAPH
ncbi:PucR family transcriptional regulator [Phytohabitans rumicis]|uniref:PucR family transcriptional regulator n=1 Tax=Phytohabitans rumicis TaxID=1076125 RepID=UPI0031E67173